MDDFVLVGQSAVYTSTASTSQTNTLELDIQLLSSSVASTSVSLQSFPSDLLQPIDLEIPEFANRLFLRDLPPSISESIAIQLDLPSLGSSVRNWQWMAYKMGMSANEIKYLEERVRHPDSPTMQVLCRFQDMTLYEFLTLLKTDVQRMDVLVQVLRSLDDAGIGCEVRPSVSNAQADESKSDFTVLVTFTPDDEQHIKYVRWLCANLKQHGATVLRDDKIHSNAVKNNRHLLTAVDSAFDKAQQVIVVLSEMYVSKIQYRDLPAVNDQASRSVLNITPSGTDTAITVAQHIHDRMQSEYLRNGCVNYRFRHIKFPFSNVENGMSTRLRGCLANAVVFAWPSQQGQLFRLIFENMALPTAAYQPARGAINQAGQSPGPTRDSGVSSGQALS